MSTTKKIEETIAPLLDSERVEMVDLQYVLEAGRRVLRIFLDKEGGINLSDCETMSHKIGALLDASDVVSDNYVLEISSPGLDRVLKKEKDFIRFSGKTARISVYAPIEGQRNFLGKILSAENGNVTIINNNTGKEISIALDKIAKARLEPEL